MLVNSYIVPIFKYNTTIYGWLSDRYRRAAPDAQNTSNRTLRTGDGPLVYET